ncbi:MAG: hypothetical protein ACRDT6_27510 [Micromonosporaceae bacterium]
MGNGGTQTREAKPARRRVSRLRRGLIVGITAVALAGGGLVGLGGLNSAEAASCPSRAEKFVSFMCLTNRWTYDVKYAGNEYGHGQMHVSLRIGTFRGVGYAYAVFQNETGNYSRGDTTVKIEGGSYGRSQRTVSSRWTRYSKAMRSSSSSSVSFKACTRYMKPDRDYVCTRSW